MLCLSQCCECCGGYTEWTFTTHTVVTDTSFVVSKIGHKTTHTVVNDTTNVVSHMSCEFVVSHTHELRVCCVTHELRVFFFE